MKNLIREIKHAYRCVPLPLLFIFE